MTPAELAETFACPHLHGTISREACAARHSSFRGRGVNAKKGEGVTGCSCRRCELGAQHARGERPDVALVVVVARSTGIRRRERLCHGCGEPLHQPQVPRSDRLYALNRNVCGPACAALVAEYRHTLQTQQIEECA